MQSQEQMTHTTSQHIGARDQQEDRCLALPDLGLYAVADGMGGHEDGDLAAQTAVDTLRDQVQGADPGAYPGTVLLHAFHAAHEAVQDLGSGLRRRPGTTLTALWFTRGRAWIAHTGDSSCYRLTAEGGMQLVTRRHLEFGRYLYAAIGCRLVVQRLRLPPRGTWLLCSDGLTDALDPADLAYALLMGESAEGLVGRALMQRRKEQDNLTAVVVRT